MTRGLTLPTPPTPQPPLPAVKVADTVLFVYDALRSGGVDSFGEICLSTTSAQGLPSTFHVVTGLNQLKGKKQQEARKLVSRSMEARFPKDKLHNLDTSQVSTTRKVVAHCSPSHQLVH